ncbi:hypothetical protein F5Y10DRAFT_78106 [Nemania abortiva]|nr:hypothetical protein F5Y10DRAFT_78106 [Nemania abortiva]
MLYGSILHAFFTWRKLTGLVAMPYTFLGRTLGSWTNAMDIDTFGTCGQEPVRIDQPGVTSRTVSYVQILLNLEILVLCFGVACHVERICS